MLVRGQQPFLRLASRPEREVRIVETQDSDDPVQDVAAKLRIRRSRINGRLNLQPVDVELYARNADRCLRSDLESVQNIARQVLPELPHGEKFVVADEHLASSSGFVQSRMAVRAERHEIIFRVRAPTRLKADVMEVEPLPFSSELVVRGHPHPGASVDAAS